MTTDEARAAVLAVYPRADVEYDEDDNVWISDDDWTPLSNECASEGAAWQSAARRLKAKATP